MREHYIPRCYLKRFSDNERSIYAYDKIHCKKYYVVTHTATTFCELQNKDELLQWTIYDNSLLDDVQKERETMDAIYTKLSAETETLTYWYYGHFHQSWHSSINGVLFKMLDIMELAEITP